MWDKRFTFNKHLLQHPKSLVNVISCILNLHIKYTILYNGVTTFILRKNLQCNFTSMGLGFGVDKWWVLTPTVL